jgi:hypothetical protein
MKSIRLLLVLTCVLFAVPAKSQENWKLRKESNGIKVFSRETKNFKFNELKVECEVDGTPSQLTALLLDINEQVDWVYKAKKSELLKTVSPGDVLFYTEVSSPWPYDNRDLIVHMTIKQQPANKVLTIEAKNVDNYLPLKKDIVRVKYSHAKWTVTPVNSNRVKIVYRIQLDLGDNIPAWVVNLFSVTGPYDTFTKLKKKIKLPKYAQAKYPFIVN